MEEFTFTQEIRPPNTKKGPVRWLKDNLFSTWYNTLFTCLAVAILYFVFKVIFTWTFTQANWGVIPANSRILSVGEYPVKQIWRVAYVIYVLAVLMGLSAGIWNGLPRQITLTVGCLGAVISLLPFYMNTSVRQAAIIATVLIAVSYVLGQNRQHLKRWVLLGWVLTFPWMMIMLHGFGENSVSTIQWGGLLLTLILAAVGIVACFPVGILLALGRRSQLPAIRWSSIVYIEVIRGVPLVLILFMGSLMFPIFMPSGFQLDKVVRAMIALTLFSAAYMAENVRGGLQAVPKGQYEAAQAVGLSYAKTMTFIVLPQALRSVIPAIVGQFIALFKDTSLVSIIALSELLGMIRRILGNPVWTGHDSELYIFAGCVYFLFCFAMSFVSQVVESELGVGKH